MVSKLFSNHFHYQYSIPYFAKLPDQDIISPYNIYQASFKIVYTLWKENK